MFGGSYGMIIFDINDLEFQNIYNIHFRSGTEEEFDTLTRLLTDADALERSKLVVAKKPPKDKGEKQVAQEIRDAAMK